MLCRAVFWVSLWIGGLVCSLPVQAQVQPTESADVPDLTRFDTFEVLSNRVIRLDTRSHYALSLVQDLLGYRLVSSDDADFVPAQSPVDIGRQHWVVDFGGNWANILSNVQRAVFLVFDRPMKPGRVYELTANGVGQSFVFQYDDQTINGSVKTSQVGYLPDSPKFGYVGNYLGSAGMMPIGPNRFEVRDAQTEEVVFDGVPTLRGKDLALSGEQVFACDFSTLKRPGRYYLYVPGIGRSYAFEVGKDVFNPVAYACLRGLFYQRCGMALQPPAADGRWIHAACHLEDGIVHGSHTQSPLYNGETVGSRVPATRGWHDAGDYGKYVPTAAVALFYLFGAYELYPERFPDGAFDLPESGNGVPDLLDEARWEVDWLKHMQAPDGGVYFKLTTTKWPTTMPELDTAPRYFAPKTTHTTGQFAAAMAMAFRAFLPYWPAYAKDCLEQAKKAWAFLEAHPNAVPAKGFVNPPEIGGGEYNDPLGDADERAWAAAELYKSTGDPYYETAFLKYWSQQQPMWGWNAFQHHQQKASWTYATTAYETRQGAVDAYLEAFKHNAEELMRRTDRSAYRNAFRSDVPEWIGWGAFAHSTQYAWELIRAHYLFGDPKYLDYAQINLDTQLGNNPQSVSYITGVGAHHPKDPLHHPSMQDQEVEPVPGLPVFGPHSRLPSDNPYFVAAKKSLFPMGQELGDPYPLLRRYLDINELVPMSEFTVLEMALTAVTFAYFSSFQATPAPPDSGLVRPGGIGGIDMDLDPAPGDQSLLIQPRFAPGDTAAIQVFAEDFPEVRSIWLKVSFDPHVLTLDKGSLVIGDFIPNATPIVTHHDTAVEIGMTSFQGATGKGSGLVGALRFYSTEAFVDSTDVTATLIDFEGVWGDQNYPARVRLVSRGPGSAGDFNDDGVVNFQDFALFLRAFGGIDPRFDLNRDGFVGLADFVSFTELFSQARLEE